MASRNIIMAAIVLAIIVIGGVIGIMAIDGDDDDEQAAIEPTAAETIDAPGQETPIGEAQSNVTPTEAASSDEEPTEAAPAGQAAAQPTATQPAVGTPRPAPSPPAEDTFGLGRPAADDTIGELDIDVPPDGSGLPDGSGTPQEGANVYAAQCAACHGQTGSEGGLGPALVSEPGPWEAGMPRTIGSYWPYATTVYDYVHRAMPFDEPGSLEPDEVYAVTAYLLWQNGIIDENEEMNADTLPQVEMPNQPSFYPCWPDECRFDNESGS